MNCQELIDGFLTDYVEQRLSAEVRIEFDRHLKLCPDCQTYVDSYIQTLHCLSGEVEFVAGFPRTMEFAYPDGLITGILNALKASQDPEGESKAPSELAAGS